MNDDQALRHMKIVDDSIVPHPSAPGGGLSFEALDIASKRINLHRKERSLNACAIFWR